MLIQDINKITRIKLLIISITFACSTYSSVSFAQISEEGIPPSFNYQLSLRSGTVITNVPVDFFVEDLRETDNWKAREGAPLPVAKLISVDYTMENSGYRTLLPGGEDIWRLHLLANDAIAIMLYYSDFYIPEGGKLFIYSADKSQLLGAYTNRTNPSGGLFATEFVGGDELILEYVASETSEEKPRICIKEIGYGYNTAALRSFCGITTRAKSGNCMVNINCEEGYAWQNEKKGVCYMIQRIGNTSYHCSGSLMNNTAEDFKPLILSAYHCAYDSKSSTYASESDMMQWMFYFHKELEDCDTNSLGLVSKTMTGCKLLSTTGMEGGSDGMLLQLNELIPEEYDVFYNGWDIREEVAFSGVCIHHPEGDYKKISTYDEPIRAYTFVSGEFKAETYAHWNVTFKETVNGFGVTEGGSSGSPLYNENKLVIGTLTGGNSSCSSPRLLNLYGKMNYHWDHYPLDSSTRMDVWLDPINSGIKTLPGRFRKVFKPSPRNLKVVNLGQSISLTWDLPQSNETPKRYNVYRNNFKIIETTLLSCIDYEPVIGSMIYSVSAVYEDNEESNIVSSTLSYVKYKAPTDLKVLRQSSGSEQVKLSWNAPLYEQTIYWGSMTYSLHAGFYERRLPFYFGQKWSADEIAPLHLKTISAVQFIPIENNVYEIYITQGEQTYRQKIENIIVEKNELNTIKLTTPFVINGSNSLIVSIYTSVAKTNYPAACDNGPQVAGKGNISSEDGLEWVEFNSFFENPADFTSNFVITAIISSETGNLATNLNSNIVLESQPKVERVKQAVVSRQAALSFVDYSVSTRSSVPAAFPEITKYRIYRNGSHHKEVYSPITNYEENNSLNTSYYEISAFYDQYESEKSEKTYISIENDNERPDASVHIFPTQFTNMLTLQGHEFVTRIEVLSVTGKVCLIVNNPDKTINTSSLTPGLYFFRIYSIHNNQKIIKAVKANR